jgi:predicted transcriptional regulator
MKKLIQKNPFLASDDMIVTRREDYIQLIFLKNVYNKKTETGRNVIDLSFKKNNFNIEDLRCLMNKKVSSCTKSVMFYVLSNLEADSDIITINTSDVSECTGYAKSAISSSLNELFKMGFVKKINGRGMNYKYWINPFKIFKGNRIEFLKTINEDYVKCIKEQLVIR